jgi:hypothetical protein
VVEVVEVVEAGSRTRLARPGPDSGKRGRNPPGQIIFYPGSKLRWVFKLSKI